MSEKLDEWFVVYDGPSDHKSGEPSPVAFPGDMEAEAFGTFRGNIALGFADVERGLHLVKLTGVTQEQAEELSDLESLVEVVSGGFAGYSVEPVESYEKSADIEPEAEQEGIVGGSDVWASHS